MDTLPALMQTGLRSRLVAQALEGPVSLTFPAEGRRFSLRVSAANLPAASEAFGVDLPATIGEVGGGAGGEVGGAARGRRALCLGPDEWMLYADEADGDVIAGAFGQLYNKAPHSLVDVSDREITLSLVGSQAATLLSVGCSIDLRDFPVGGARRTVFDGVSVVLHCDGEENFRLEVWRSFLPHVWELLNAANRELASGF